MARFTNQAQLRYGNAVANSNIAVGEILEVLSATKDSSPYHTYGQNDHITYVDEYREFRKHCDDGTYGYPMIWVPMHLVPVQWCR